MQFSHMAAIAALLVNHALASPIVNAAAGYYGGPGKYYITNFYSKTAMEIDGKGPATAITGNELVGNARQTWQILSANYNNQIQIVNAANGATASCNSANQLVGGQVPVDGKSLFTLIYGGDSTSSVRFQSVGNPGLCLDLAYGNATNKTPIICYPCHATTDISNQNWILYSA